MSTVNSASSQSQTQSAVPSAPISGIPISLEDLLTLLSKSPESQVVFYFEGVSIHPGYHVTEIKHALVRSIDCGRNEESWNEVTVQLFDGSPKSNQGYMGSTKLLSLLKIAASELPEFTQAKLYFEYAPENGPMMKLAASVSESADQNIHIQLSAENAACKPFLRALAKNGANAIKNSACCSSESTSEASCCISSAASKRSKGSCCG